MHLEPHYGVINIICYTDPSVRVNTVVRNVCHRIKAKKRRGCMMHKLRGVGALVLTIVAGLASAQGIPDVSSYDL